MDAGHRVRRSHRLLLLVAVCAALAAVPGAASASHSWAGYHWSVTAYPFTLQLGNNTTGAWTTSGWSGTGSYLANVSTDWSTLIGAGPQKLSTTIVTGAGGKRCSASAGRVEVCNDAYGRNGWLGLASIWLSGGHISQGTVKLNDSYFGSGSYNTREWRRSVMCQEVGHTFGLDHQSENREVNTGSCMDYYKIPNISPNTHDFDQLALIYNHTHSTSTVKAATASVGQLVRVRDDLWIENLGGGHVRAVFVTWTDRGARHVMPPAGA